jgi:hypothetical protein
MTAELLDLTRSLARPLLQRKVSAGQVWASIVNAIVKAERDGTLEGTDDLAGRIDRCGAALGEFLRNEDAERAKTRAAIVCGIEPLIAARRTQDRVLTEAHAINGDAGFPFAEREVQDIVTTEIFWMMRRGGQRVG